jgi:pimeloyl-ACP methyl ester carboxylesterase
MPLVLLHGLPNDCSTWEQVAPGLAAAGYRVITPDQRGHGRSARTQHLLARLAGLVPDAELVTIEGAGHAVHRTRPTEFLATATPFLRRILPASAPSGSS